MNRRTRELAVIVGLIALGFLLSRILPGWLWAALGPIGFVAILWLSIRQNRANRRRQPPGRTMPPEYRAPANGGSPQ
jgi:hypothetical protein